jgi:hypothetical protein
VPPSFRSIDYSLRPAKHAERKMLLEFFRRLAVFAPLSDYRYLGLGSVWFSDFILVHRSLGLSDMVSIEREVSAEARIRDNIPFAAVEPIFLSTAEAIPTLDWSKRQIVWLDYDDPICPSIMEDVGAVGRRLISGSVLVVSVQHHHASEVDHAEAAGTGNAADLFRARFDRDLIPPTFSEDDLYGRPFAKLSRDMIHTAAEKGASISNAQDAATKHASLGMTYQRVCNIEYSDGAPMTTTVGVVYNADEEGQFRALSLTDVDFLPEGLDSLIRIRVPKITPSEARRLEQQLPRSSGYSCGHIPSSDADAFATFYRYLPNFADVSR